MVARHEALRTTFATMGFLQIIAPALVLSVPCAIYRSGEERDGESSG
jgi:hypothetical protein